MDDKFNPKDKFYCTRRSINLTYLECQAYFLEGSSIECNDAKNHLACITGEENDVKINQYHTDNKKMRGKQTKKKTKTKSIKRLEPEMKQGKSKRIDFKRMIYFSSHQDLFEKVEKLAKANIRTFSEQVLWMIQEYLFTHPDIDELKHEKAKQQAITDNFLSVKKVVMDMD